MALSKLNVVNNALSHLGAKLLQSLSQDDKEAKTMNELWDTSRQYLLGMHPWSFAGKRVQLSSSATTPAFGYTYSFVLPGDCLQVRKVNDKVANYQIEGRNILFDDTSINLEYTFDETNPGNWDPVFANAMAIHLAFKASYILVSDKTFQDVLSQRFNLELARAKFQNTPGRPSQKMEATDWIDARVYAE